MSNHRNQRREEEARTEHGPRWENANPGAGCNSTHVAGSRAKWKKYKSRAERRTGGPARGYAYRSTPPQPVIDE